MTQHDKTHLLYIIIGHLVCPSCKTHRLHRNVNHRAWQQSGVQLPAIITTCSCWFLTMGRFCALQLLLLQCSLPFLQRKENLIARVTQVDFLCSIPTPAHIWSTIVKGIVGSLAIASTLRTTKCNGG